jgi:hypothetical protein
MVFLTSLSHVFYPVGSVVAPSGPVFLPSFTPNPHPCRDLFTLFGLLLTISQRTESQTSVSTWFLQNVFRFFSTTVEDKESPCCNGNVSFHWECCEEVFCFALNYYLFGFATATYSVTVMAIKVKYSYPCNRP